MPKCTHCYQRFETGKYEGMKLCWTCWRKRERAFAEWDNVCDRVISLEIALSKASKHETIPAELLQRMIRLCHPDRHGNSKASNEVTQWLLDQRKRQFS